MRRRSLLVTLAIVALVAAVSAIVASASYGSRAKKSAGSIEVFSLWGGSEQDAFLKVTKAFTAKTGIDWHIFPNSIVLPALTTRPTSRSFPARGTSRRSRAGAS